MTNLDVKQEASLSGRLADQMRMIYLTSFPPSERKDFSDLVDAVNKGDELVFAARVMRDIVGFALVQRLSYTGVFLLEYMAVAKERRGEGIGSALFQHMAKTLRDEKSAEGLLLEVEPPDKGSDAEMDVRRRRVAFYRRNGAEIVAEANSYRMPDLSGKGSVEMRLMWLGLKDEGVIISGQKLRDCIVSIYRESYGRSEDGPLLRSVLQGIEVRGGTK
jgi:ribosomal protein S18 acetylase RimI-like enzyme